MIHTHTMDDIETLADAYAKAYEQLSDYVSDMQAEIEKFKRARRARLKKLVQDAANAKTSLSMAVETSPDLFKRPKTRVLHGMKVGFRKSKGKLVWDNEEYVIKTIKKLYDDEAGVLIKTEEKPNKDALEKLPASDLKKLGIEIEGAGDQVIIKSVDGDIDKLVNALMCDEDEEIKVAA